MDQSYEPEKGGLTLPGTLYSYTTVYIGPKGITTPYLFGWIETEQGRFFARVKGDPALDVPGNLTRIPGEGWWFECAK